MTGRLRFSSDLIDHRFDRSYSFDHAGRLSTAFSGAEARGEAATTNRPYRQTYGYDVMGHLTARDNYQWTTHQTSSDSYTNNRHNQVGQLYQFDADGRMTNGEYVSYTYDATGQAKTVWSGSTATLSLDGDGQQVKTVEVTYDPQTQTDVTTTKYYVRSTVLGGEVLTELEPDGYHSRSFVYAGSAVLATQESWGGAAFVFWEHRDPSNASYRTSAVGTSVGDQAELDPVGSNKGVSDPTYTQSIPDEGALAPYPSFSNPAQPNLTYAIDGVRVPLDHFMAIFNLNFKSNLHLAEQVAGTSTPRLIGYSVWRHSEHARHHYGLNTFASAYPDAVEERNFALDWSATSNWDFDSSLLPQKPVPAPGPDPTAHFGMDDNHWRNFMKGYNVALSRLNDPNCLRAISALGGDLTYSAKDILKGIFTRHGFEYVGGNEEENPIARTSPWAGLGVHSTIKLYDKFFNGVQGASNVNMEGLNYAETLAHAILHEIVHALGGHHDDWNTEAGRKEGKRWNDAIYDNCFAKQH